MEWAMFVNKIKKERINDYIEKVKSIPIDMPQQPEAAKNAGLRSQLVFVDNENSVVYIIMGSENMKEFMENFSKIEDVQKWNDGAKPMIEEKKDVIYLDKIYDFEDVIKKMNIR